MNELDIIRRAYAKQVMAAADVRDRNIEDALFRIERRGPSYAAQWLGPIEVFPCVGQARNEHGAEALRHALRKGGQEFVRSLHRHNDVPFERCWLWADGWCLSYDEPT